jgi:alpha-glucosidase
MKKRIAAALSSLLSVAVLLGATHAGAAAETSAWWHNAVIYEIYPRSFADSNGDGVGDLNGITQHLDYLRDLGVDAIWIAPMYPSPQVDFGYDISDYRNVDPLYGSLADFDRLQAQARQRGMRIVLDMVLNHASDQHPWFVESSSSRHNPKSDWYVWHPGVSAKAPDVTAYQRRFEHEGRVPPNNWESLFGGSAWEWNGARKQFYYHKFYKQQPDLNWRNPAVEAAMFDVMKFWLDRGVSGFRLDAIPTLFEDAGLRNEPEAGGINAQGDPNLKEIYTANLEEAHATLRRLSAMVDRYAGDRVLIGETYVNNTADLDRWYGGERHGELQLPMDMLVGFGAGAKFDAGYFRRTIGEVETQVHGGAPLLVFDNHDNARSIDRFGDGVHDLARAKVLAAILLMPRDAAMTYYGAPIGMVTHTPTQKSDVKDPIGITGWPAEKGRDGERTPMQWTPGPQAGFSSNPQTWLPVGADHDIVNVQSESTDPHSLLNWYKRLIALRRSNQALRDGNFTLLDTSNPDVLSFVRQSRESHAATVVSLNLSAEPRTATIDLSGVGIKGTGLRPLAATPDALLSIHPAVGAVTLPPYAVLVAAAE